MRFHWERNILHLGSALKPQLQEIPLTFPCTRHSEIPPFILPLSTSFFTSAPLFCFCWWFCLWDSSISSCVVCSFSSRASVSSSVEWGQEWYLPRKDVWGLREFSHVKSLEESLRRKRSQVRLVKSRQTRLMGEEGMEGAKECGEAWCFLEMTLGFKAAGERRVS